MALTPAHSSRSGRKSTESGVSNLHDFSIDDDIESGFVPSSHNVTDLSDYQLDVGENNSSSLFFPQNFPADHVLRNEAAVAKSTPITVRVSYKSSGLIKFN